MKSNRKSRTLSTDEKTADALQIAQNGAAATVASEHRRTIKLSTMIAVAVATFIVGAVYGAASAENGTGLAEVVKFGRAPAYATSTVSPAPAAKTASPTVANPALHHQPT